MQDCCVYCKKCKKKMEKKFNKKKLERKCKIKAARKKRIQSDERQALKDAKQVRGEVAKVESSISQDAVGLDIKHEINEKKPNTHF